MSTSDLARLEHVNLTVTDAPASAARLERLFGWHVRWEGASQMGGRSIHVGTDDQYLVVYQAPGDGDSGRRPGRLNHVGVLVDDLDAVERRVRDEGLEPCNFGDYEPGRRFYFDDPDGIEFEVVSYA